MCYRALFTAPDANLTSRKLFPEVVFLLHNNKEVLFLTLLGDEVLTVQKVGLGDELVELLEFFFVDADTTALGEFTHLALGGEAGCGLGQQIDGFGTDDLLALHLIVRHTGKDIEERLLIKFQEALLRRLAKEDIGSFEGHLIVGATVNEAGYFFAEPLLQHATTGVGTMFLDETLYLVVRQRGEYLDVAFGLLVTYIEPELIELVRTGALAVEPYIALLGLAELLTISLGDKGAGEGEGFSLGAEGTADEFGAGGDITPLVASTHLQAAALLLIEMKEVVALQQLIGELSERHTVLGLTVETALDTVLSHHIVHGDALAYLTGKVEEGEVLHPVVVVHEFGSIGSITLEVEEMAELLLDALYIVAQCLLGEEVALLALAGGVANHTGGTAHEGKGLVTSLLKMTEHHHATEVADMERVGGGVNAYIGRHHLAFVKQFLRAGHHLMKHTAPLEFFYKVHK